jgi:enoyl-CoA hydratase/carnithine racemase
MMSESGVKWEIVDSIGVITFTSQPRNQIFSPDFVDLPTLKSWVEHSSVRGLVICGEGRHFSSGADLDELKRLSVDYTTLRSKMQDGNAVINYLQNVSIPTVAAISGACFGAGLEIALACHIRICTGNAMIAFPESSIDLIPGLGGTVRLLRTTCIATALQMLLSGEPLDAQTAMSAGIVSQVIDEKNVSAYSIEYLKKLVHNKSPQIIKAVVECVNNAIRLPESEALAREVELFCGLALKKFK